MSYSYHTLNNGIRIVFRPTASPVTYSGVYIGVGSRDESGPDEGIAHFIEHSIFKGTTHRQARHILTRIDGVGGELNAFTTKEETCIYASSLGEHLERCLQLFADILFNSTFPEKEIQNEKDVVLEEINSYRDSPADLIFDDFEEQIFAGHPIAHNILGTSRNVRRFTSERLLHFMKSNYTTDRMAIAIVGNADFRKVVRLCEKYFSDHPLSSSAVDRSVPPQCRQFQLTLNRHTHQMHVLLGCQAPSMFDDSKVAFTLLNNLLGGPAMNSRLNVAIRERYGFCYTIESQYTPFSDTGLFYIYAGIDPAARDRFIELVAAQLRNVIHKALTPLALRAAQRQYVAQMAIGGDSGMSEMQAIGKSLLSYGRVDTLDEMRRDIEAVTASELADVADRYLQPEKLSILIYK